MKRRQKDTARDAPSDAVVPGHHSWLEPRRRAAGIRSFRCRLSFRRRWAVLLFAVLLRTQWGCVVPRRPTGSFEVVRDKPSYVLRSPESVAIPFPEVLRQYSGFTPGEDWIDLRPHMELRVEHAYYRDGVPRHGIFGFLGTEVAIYQVRVGGGLRLRSVRSMKHRPMDQLPVQRLICAEQRRFRHGRFFFALVFRRSANARSSVLLSADARQEMDALTSRLIRSPESVCEDRSAHCTVFPEACSVSLEIEVTVNRATRTVPYGSTVSDVVVHPRSIRMQRLDAGRMTQVQIDASDPEALRLPLLPNDRITWN